MRRFEQDKLEESGGVNVKVWRSKQSLALEGLHMLRW
jgi:hypothetical protein